MYFNQQINKLKEKDKGDKANCARLPSKQPA